MKRRFALLLSALSVFVLALSLGRGALAQGGRGAQAVRLAVDATEAPRKLLRGMMRPVVMMNRPAANLRRWHDHINPRSGE